MNVRTKKTTTAMALATALVVLVALLGPTVVMAQTDVPLTERSLGFSTRLTGVGDIVKFRDEVREVRAFAQAKPRKLTPIPEPAVTRSTTRSTSTARTSGTSTAATTKPATTTSAGTATGGTNELARAQSILAGYIAKYPILAGTTVTIGQTPGGHQAVAYYTVGKIVISPTHTASLERILAHEIWHVIDWRDNGRIDWGESVPPKN